jgi:soluble lytic murein transglycosylase-like protein
MKNSQGTRPSLRLDKVVLCGYNIKVKFLDVAFAATIVCLFFAGVVMIAAGIIVPKMKANEREQHRLASLAVSIEALNQVSMELNQRQAALLQDSAEVSRTAPDTLVVQEVAPHLRGVTSVSHQTSHRVAEMVPFPLINLPIVSSSGTAGERNNSASLAEDQVKSTQCQSASQHRLADIATCIEERYGALIRKAAEAERVPQAILVAVMIASSDGNPKAVRSGCLGLMQLCPATLHDLGIKPDQALDPEINISGSARLLGKHFASTAGNSEKALAYYGHGKKSVDQRVTDEGEFDHASFGYSVRVMNILEQLEQWKKIESNGRA